MSTGEEPLEQVLSQLDRWRHLPKYRLEQHVDVLFGMTLPSVIRSKFKTDGKLHVIPEFPIKTGDHERTFNVDFAVLTHGGGEVYLVELKTDSKSIKEEQLCQMRGKGRRQFRCLLDDICDVAKASPEKAKYLHLICELERAGTMKVGKEIKDLDPCDLRGFKAAAKCLSAKKTVTSIPELVLISPRRDQVKACTRDFHCIDFREYADLISPPLERTFARYLGEWQSEAGKKRPCWLPADSPNPDS